MYPISITAYIALYRNNYIAFWKDPTYQHILLFLTICLTWTQTYDQILLVLYHVDLSPAQGKSGRMTCLHLPMCQSGRKHTHPAASSLAPPDVHKSKRFECRNHGRNYYDAMKWDEMRFNTKRQSKARQGRAGQGIAREGQGKGKGGARERQEDGKTRQD